MNRLLTLSILLALPSLISADEENMALNEGTF